VNAVEIETRPRRTVSRIFFIIATTFLLVVKDTNSLRKGPKGRYLPQHLGVSLNERAGLRRSRAWLERQFRLPDKRYSGKADFEIRARAPGLRPGITGLVVGRGFIPRARHLALEALLNSRGGNLWDRCSGVKIWAVQTPHPLSQEAKLMEVISARTAKQIMNEQPKLFGSSQLFIHRFGGKPNGLMTGQVLNLPEPSK
jgi:hypothetical protein